MSASFNLSLHEALCGYEYVLLLIFYFILFCTWTRIFRQKEKNRQEKENERQIEKEKDRQIEKEKDRQIEKEKERQLAKEKEKEKKKERERKNSISTKNACRLDKNQGNVFQTGQD